MPVITEFDNQDWSIFPVAPALGAPPARSIDQQKWVLNLTGVVIPNFKSGVGGSQWGRETIDFFPDSRTPLTHALLEADVPIPPRPAYDNRPYLEMEQWTLFATINAIYDAHKAVDAGFAVDRWRPIKGGIIDQTGAQNYNVFAGMSVDIAARDVDAWVYRVGYSITLIGRIVIGFEN